MSAAVHSLAYYPVKSCAGTSVEATELTEAGLRHDRRYMLVGLDGDLITQRRFPVMATIRPRVSDGGARLALSAPGAGEFTHYAVVDGPLRAVSVFRWSGEGVDQGDEAASWFSDVLGTPCRLVGVPRGHQRVTSGLTPGTTGFADAHALLVLSCSSLDALNERIAERGHEPVPMERFRPNIVISGWPDPHTEDRVLRMRVGTAELGYAKRCVRCPMPTIDQRAGRWSGPEPTRTLARYRREPEGGVTFGAKAAVLRPGVLAVADPVTVTQWGM